MLNEGHAVDVAELGADEETGADVLYEVKCKSALCKKYSAGKGSAALGGQPKSRCSVRVGHTRIGLTFLICGIRVQKAS